MNIKLDECGSVKYKHYRFFLHYNKPMSASMGLAVWTVHWRGNCFQALNIQCQVPTETHTRKIQPRGVVRGYADMLELSGPLPEKDTLYTKAYICMASEYIAIRPDALASRTMIVREAGEGHPGNHHRKESPPRKSR